MKMLAVRPTAMADMIIKLRSLLRQTFRHDIEISILLEYYIKLILAVNCIPDI